MVIIQDYKTRLHLLFILWSGWALAPWNTSLACTANPYCKLKRQKMHLNVRLLWLFEKSTVPFTEIVIWSWMPIQNKSVVKLNMLCIYLYLVRNWILMEVSYLCIYTQHLLQCFAENGWLSYFKMLQITQNNNISPSCVPLGIYFFFSSNQCEISF